MNIKSYKHLLLFALIAWSLFILYGSFAPADDLSIEGFWALIPHLDKVVHFVFYFVQTLLLMLLFAPYRWVLRLVVLLSVLLFSGAVEMLQAMFFDRSGDLHDFAANTLGALSAFAIAPMINKLTVRLLGLFGRGRS